MNYEIDDDEITKQLLDSIPDEGTTAYMAFVVWIGLPPTERYANDALEKLAEKTNFAATTLKAYRSEFKWFERAKRLDAHFAMMQFKKRVEVNEEHNLQFAAEARSIQNKALELSKKGLAVCEKLLNAAEKEGKQVEMDYYDVLQKDGTTKRMAMTHQTFMETALRDVSPLLRACVDVPTKVAGLPVETAPIEGQTIAGNFQGKTKAELEEMKKKLAKERAKIHGIDSSSTGIN